MAQRTHSLDTGGASALLVTGDDLLLDEVLRLAAAAGVNLDVAHDTSAAGRSWAAASVVLVGADQAAALARSGPPRRARVQVVARDGVPDALFRHAVELGAENVAELPASEAWLVETLTDAGDGGAGLGVTLGVVAGSGGAGATTLVGALGTLAAEAGDALVVDLDPWGPGLDRVLGLDGRDGIRWDALHQSTGRLSSRALRDAVPRRHGLGVLTWAPGPASPPPAFVAREALSAARRGHRTVVLDLPRNPDAVRDVLTRCDHLIVVAGTTVPAVAAAGRLLDGVRDLVPSYGVVARGVARGAWAREVADTLGAPLWGAMGDQRGLAEAVDLGAGPVRSRRGVLARTARGVLDRLTPRETGAAA